ncbi:hypothetical protein GCM10012279_30450 [Micromonospora yangpuensis]|uniref:Uncharacterized protein n=2 Tax=Micromonospora yangpuensis TaxID=683228 RepID=A0A1C6U2L7_9ACTN|nr:hypothetical protein GCM10012279_30450 [Micromonospora yangpuensis]SCL48173.1 hypothetical protein GA0070617_0798 [Micromonospora yangpuensis]
MRHCFHVKNLADNIPSMFNEDVERIREALGPLCEPLHDVFTWADQQRKKALPELDGLPEYRWHATHTIRAFAHLRLRQIKIDSWNLAGNHSRNGELWLTDGDYRARLLHTIRDADVPAAGSNAARQAYYRNVPLFTLAQQRLTGPPDDRLLFVWRIDLKTGVPAFRVVRPIGNWKWGDHAETDIDFILPETAEDLAVLEFEPSDEGMELDIPNEDQLEGGIEDAGGSAG